MEKERNKNWQVPFFTIWIGQQLSLFGSELAGFGLTWWVTESTGSAMTLATMTMIMMLPGVLLGPFVGALIDRWNRRTVMIIADSIVALFSAWLVYLLWVDALQMWHVYLITLVRAIGGVFHWPAMSASTSLMVPEKHLSRVAGINQTMMGIRSIISPPLGALLMTLLPLPGIMGIDVVTAALAIVPLFFIHIPQPERKPVPTEAKTGLASLWHDVREGLLYVWHWPGLMGILIMATLINLLLNPAFSLMPLLVTKHFGGQEFQLGWMNSVWGIGVVVGGLILSTWGGFKRRILTTLLGLLGMGVGTLLLGLAPSTAFGLALGAMLFVGLMNPITNGPVNAIFQSSVEPEMQGRVFTLIGSACQAMSPLGMAIAGPVADKFGVQSWFLIGGTTCVLMSLIGYLTPAIINVEKNKQHPATVEKQELAAIPVQAGTET